MTGLGSEGIERIDTSRATCYPCTTRRLADWVQVGRLFREMLRESLVRIGTGVLEQVQRGREYRARCFGRACYGALTGTAWLFDELYS